MPSKPDEVSIGNFDKPVVPRPSGQSPTEERLIDAEQRLAEDAKKDEAALKPMQSFADRLKEAGITLEKAAEIVDNILLKGYHSEPFKVTSRVKMSLRSRGARDTKRAQEILDAARHQYDHHYRESLTRILLASSLESFGDTKLAHAGKGATAEDIEKAFHERMAYVDAMAEPALLIAYDKLFKFDRMISAACAEGTIENF